MPVVEIRESIDLPQVDLNRDSPKVIERVINLKTGFRNEVTSVDFFLDNPFCSIPLQEQNAGLMEVLVTSRPMLLTDETFKPTTMTNATPSMSNDYVLAKQHYEPFFQKWRINAFSGDFPNEGRNISNPTTFYTPKLYLYIVLHAVNNALIYEDIRLSARIVLKQTKAASLVVLLGNIREFSLAQIAKISSMGRIIDKSRLTGQYFPLYMFGGIRPQFMATSNTLSNFYLGNNPLAAENTLTPDQLRAIMKRSRTMVSYDKAFGGVSPSIGAVPDWFNSVQFLGTAAGAVREQFPPLKFADNGNVRML